MSDFLAQSELSTKQLMLLNEYIKHKGKASRCAHYKALQVTPAVQWRTLHRTPPAIESLRLKRFGP
jgi:hypothetical protein